MTYFDKTLQSIKFARYKLYVPMIEMKQLIPLQAMNLNFMKLTQLYLIHHKGCDLHSTKEKMENIDQMLTIQMGKLHCSSWNCDVKNHQAMASSIFIRIQYITKLYYSNLD